MSSKKHVQPKREPLDLNHIFFSLILIVYGFVAVLTPNLKTLDSNGPKFLAIAVLNILVFLFLFLRKDQKLANWAFGGFFRNPVAIAYSLLMVVSLLSFTVATNVNESILHFAKIFTVFSAAWMIATIVHHDNKSFRYLAIAMSALLVYDCITVFLEISRFLEGEIKTLTMIKSVYSNKNILASSIFVKIPFAFWLMLYEPKWGRIPGLIVIIMAVAATFFMSARAFYLGVLFLSLGTVVFLVIRYRQTGNKRHLAILAQLAAVVILGFATFIVVQKVAYPKSGKGYYRGIVSRFKNLKTERSAGLRVQTWKNSFNLIKENPLLGIGLGNWKVDILQQENLTNPNFIYTYKAHNDFIETTTETGIFGGLFFLAIFALVFYNLVRVMKKNADDERLKFAFIPALGLFCYSFDAFFNFPQDRPSIQALFVLYTGAAIALSFIRDPADNKADAEVGLNKPDRKWMVRLSTLALAGVLVASCYILIWNFNSLKLQRLIKDEMNRKVLKLPASMFLSEFPPIPNINVVGEPIAVQKARYLISEKRYQEAIDLLRSDHSSPYDMRREFFTAMAFNNMGQYDSALVYNQKVYAQKPRLFDNNTMMASIYERKKDYAAAVELWDKFLDHTKDNPRAWVYAASINERNGDINKAYAIIDSGKKYLPRDTLVQKNHKALFQKFKIEPYRDTYQKAVNEFNAKRYTTAARLFDAFIEKVPDYPSAYELRAFCNYFNKSYERSLVDIDNFVKYGGTLRGNVVNLRGINYWSLKNNTKACEYFEAAMKMGDSGGTTNYNRFCKPKTTPKPKVTNTDPLKVFN